MRKMIALFCLMNIWATTVLANVPIQKREELKSEVRYVLTTFRNRLQKADTPEKYEKVIEEMGDFVAQKANSRSELLERKVTALKDFEMRPLLIEHYTKRIERDSTNLLWLVRLCNDSWDWCFDFDWLWLWVVFGIVMLEDDQVTSDI